MLRLYLMRQNPFNRVREIVKDSRQRQVGAFDFLNGVFPASGADQKRRHPCIARGAHIVNPIPYKKRLREVNATFGLPAQ